MPIVHLFVLRSAVQPTEYFVRYTFWTLSCQGGVLATWNDVEKQQWGGIPLEGI